MSAKGTDRGAAYAGAQTFGEYLAGAVHNIDLWRGIYARARVPDALAAGAASLGGEWHLLALSEDWCGDAVNTLPYVARLAEAAPNQSLRVLTRDDHADIMNAHLSPSGGRAIPVVIVLDADYRERGWWGSRPRPLQDWVMSIGRGLAPTDRYREVRRWYARDRGTTTLAEITALLADVAGVHASPAKRAPHVGAQPRR